MRLHSLSFAAIGPFAGEHVIDFDALGDSALFLIDGPTGAGKSTVIDALVFALYGEVAGDTDKERLRSHYADPSVETYCEVDVSVAGGRIKVRRTPAYDRAKKRGTGTTPVPSTVQVWRSVGPSTWEHVSSAKGEADAEISEAIGLNRAQFVQTVVLPQGEFATFLRAESAERLPMLERIFATGVYRQVQEHLDGRRRDAERGIAEALAGIDAAVQRAVGALVGTPWQEQLVELLGEGSPSEVTWGQSIHAVLASLASASADAFAIQASREAALVAAQAARETAVGLVERQGALTRAETAELDALADLADAQTALDEVSQAFDGIDGVDAQREHVVQVADSLRIALTAEQQLPSLRAARAAGEARIAENAESIAALVQARDLEIPAGIAMRAVELRTRLARSRAAVADAEAVLRSLHERRIHGMAGELASVLADGAPCPVCGSITHPHPAEPHPQQVDPVDIELQSEAVGERRDLAQAQGAASAMADAVAVRVGSVESAEQVSGTDAQLSDEIAALAEEFDAADRRIAELEADSAAVAPQVAEAIATIAERELAVEAARAGYATVQARLAWLDGVLTRFDAIATAQTVVQQTRIQLEAAKSALGDSVAPSADELGRLTQARVEAQREAAEASTRVTRLSELAHSIESASDAVAAAFAEHAERVRAAGPLLLVARALAGAGGGLSLATYAVQQVFDEVVAAANARLRGMLDGRFQLMSTEERTGARRMDTGLGLKVRDLANDTERRTSTLSGGESFCASLALALGLADTVRAHAGGVEIDTLFVDEGFGSLDAERLGDVMDELLRLRSDGRTVGVISHVTEMKQSIHERIDVTSLAMGEGSTLRANWMTS